MDKTFARCVDGANAAKTIARPAADLPYAAGPIPSASKASGGCSSIFCRMGQPWLEVCKIPYQLAAPRFAVLKIR